MMEVHEAQANILASAHPCVTTETVALHLGLQRSLAAAIVSDTAVPPADNSAMDGYAVHTDSLAQLPATLPLSQTIPAGTPAKPLALGTAARILTGAEIPQGANTVVIQENTTANSDNTVCFTHSAQPGDNIRRRGQDIPSGIEVLPQGHRLRAADLGLLASLGIAQIEVNQRLKVAIISTGDELVPPGAPLGQGQIYNSNQVMMQSLVREHGADVSYQHHVADDKARIISALREAASCSDVIISTGGVSVGDEDHMKSAVAETGELDFWKVRVKPGKPIAFGYVRHNNKNTHFIGLPGNPVSAYVTFLLFAKPLLCALGHENYRPPLHIKAKARFSVDKARRRPEYMRARVDQDGVELHPNQSSGVLSAVCWSNALVLLHEGQTVREGDMVDVLFFTTSH